MNIHLKLTPYMSEQYSMEPNFLRFPVSFSYEEEEGLFIHHITGGIPVIGRVNPDNKLVSYFIGDTCTVEQLTKFANDLSRNIQTSVVFSESEDVVNSIEYDPALMTWKHCTGSKMGNIGSTMTLHLTQEALKQFREALENYRRFAIVQIEGHKRLVEDIANN